MFHNLKDHLKVSHHPSKFGGRRHCGSEDIMVLVCHMISQDDLIKGSYNFLGRSPSGLAIILPSLMPSLFIPKTHDISCFHTRNFRM